MSISDNELKKIANVCFRSPMLDGWLSRFPSQTRPEDLDFTKDKISDDFVLRFSEGYRTAQAGKALHQAKYSWYQYDSIFRKGYEIGKDPSLIEKEKIKRKEEYAAAVKKQQDWDTYVVENEARRIANERTYSTRYTSYDYSNISSGYAREPMNAQERAEEESFIYGTGKRPNWY